MVRERCCCGCMHVTTGVTVLATVVLISAIINIVAIAVTPHSAAIMGTSVTAIVIRFIVSALAIVAVFTKHHLFLIPFNIVLVLSVLLSIILFVIFLLGTWIVNTPGYQVILDAINNDPDFRSKLEEQGYVIETCISGPAQYIEGAVRFHLVKMNESLSVIHAVCIILSVTFFISILISAWIAQVGIDAYRYLKHSRHHHHVHTHSYA